MADFIEWLYGRECSKKTLASEREPERERKRETHTHTKQRQGDRDRDKQRQTETETDRDREKRIRRNLLIIIEQVLKDFAQWEQIRFPSYRTMLYILS